MKGYLGQVKTVRDKYGNCPIICTGDIFDDGWRPTRCPPELINFALQELPNGMWCVPGQHDLPHHNYSDVKKSAYWTLAKAKKISDIPTGGCVEVNDDLCLHGYGWGSEPGESFLTSLKTKGIHVAVCHYYIWTEGHTFPSAPLDHRWDIVQKKLNGFRSAVFGDNHQPFLLNMERGQPHILNGGSFMRRKRDEINHKPYIGLLYHTGMWGAEFLDCSKDKWIDIPDSIKKLSIDPNYYEEVIEMLGAMSAGACDFVSAVTDHLASKKFPPEVRKLILQSISED